MAVFDENGKPGGQLFKQIHKFFGSREHKAKLRGFTIGRQLLAEADAAGVEVVLNAVVIGLYLDKEAVVRLGDETGTIRRTPSSRPTGLQKKRGPLRAGPRPAASAEGQPRP